MALLCSVRLLYIFVYLYFNSILLLYIYIYIFRGGFHSLFLCNLVKASGCVVLFLDYKRSPEFTYPVPQDDCFAAYEYVVSELERLQLSQSVSLFIGGDSAGGALAVETLTRAVASRSQGNKSSAGTNSSTNSTNSSNTIAGGILLSPWTDIFNFDDKSWTENKDYDFLDADQLRHCANLHYRHESLYEQSRISPVNQSLVGLPPLLIEAGAREAFIDQIRAFRDHAARHGVQVSLNEYEDMVHAFHMLIFTKTEAIYKSIGSIARFMDDPTGDDPTGE